MTCDEWMADKNIAAYGQHTHAGLRLAFAAGEEAALARMTAERNRLINENYTQGYRAAQKEFERSFEYGVR